MFSLPQIKSLFKKNGYKINDRPYELNIVGIRSQVTRPNHFDDEIHVFYKTNGLNWEYHRFHATTDPGTYWLKHPMILSGTAILAEGQYKNAYKLGLHRGQYLALVQIGRVSVIRDFNRNNKLDFFSGTKRNGYYGINIHRASINGTTKYVDKYSAGCQVFANISDFNHFLSMCKKHKTLYGNKFTYTLIDQRMLERRKYQLIALTVGAIALGTGVATYYLLDHE
jgi:hypothetical protein